MSREKDGRSTTESHCRAHAATLFGSVFRHIDHDLLLVADQILAELRRVRPTDSADVTREFDGGALHAETDALRVNDEL